MKTVSFATQKGGIGKTAFTMITCSYNYYVLHKRVGVIDCDFPQHTFAKEREDEIKQIRTLPDKMEAFKKLNIKPYNVLKSDPASTLIDMKKFTESGEEFDYIFVDLPGTVNTPGVLKTVATINHVFVPLVADTKVIRSSLEFGQLIQEKLIAPGNFPIRSLHFYWNMVVKSEKTDLYEKTNEALDKLGLQRLNTVVESTVKFRKPGFCSTMFPMDFRYIKDTRMLPLIEEVNSVLEKN